jgi:hypothetical protein
MAHWAKINSDNTVEEVIKTSNDDLDEGLSWISENLPGTWIKTSLNTSKGQHRLGGMPLRMNFAEIGGTYLPERDAFVPPKKEGQEDFILDETILSWVPEAIPADADYALPYGPEPLYVEKEITDKDGKLITVKEQQISEDDTVYIWIHGDNPRWWLNPNSSFPKPGDGYFWDGSAKEWIELQINNTPE